MFSERSELTEARSCEQQQQWNKRASKKQTRSAMKTMPCTMHALSINLLKRWIHGRAIFNQPQNSDYTSTLPSPTTASVAVSSSLQIAFPMQVFVVQCHQVRHKT
eukprot:4682274-Amphidinium_carterae.1